VTDAPGQLDYAPKPQALRGARARRAAIIIGALIVLAATIWVAPRAYQRWQVIRLQRACAAYTAPPTQVVHETDPAQIPALLASPLNYRGSVATGQAFLIPPVYGKLVVSQSVGTAFLHERTTPGGERRLVTVDLYGAMASGKDMSLLGTVLDLSARGNAPRACATLGDGRTIALQPGDQLRVFAGQPDPSDPSHFTIDSMVNDVRHTLDGWLVDETTIKIETRD
jgi:hypothetical protein